MIIKTYKEILEIDGLVAQLYTENSELKQSKFGYSYGKFYEKYFIPMKKDYSDALEEIRIDNALTDETTHALLIDSENPRGFKYSKEGQKACIKAENALVEKLNAKEVEIEPYFSTFIPPMTPEQQEKLEGTIINSKPVKETK